MEQAGIRHAPLVAALGFEPFDYQLQTARSALRRMRGRAILADEVGLGKTIEAGLILSELRLRGLAERTLVLTPAGLVDAVAGGAGAQVRPAHGDPSDGADVPDCRGRPGGWSPRWRPPAATR